MSKKCESHIIKFFNGSNESVRKNQALSILFNLKKLPDIDKLFSITSPFLIASSIIYHTSNKYIDRLSYYFCIQSSTILKSYNKIKIWIIKTSPNDEIFYFEKKVRFENC